MKTPHVERTTVDVLLVEAGARPEANVVAGDLVIEQAGRHDGRRTVPAVGELVGPDPTDDVFRFGLQNGDRVAVAVGQRQAIYGRAHQRGPLLESSACQNIHWSALCGRTCNETEFNSA